VIKVNNNKGSLISIIIPANNEERVIERCLNYLQEGLNPEETEIIVVCNGCTDRTATVVQSMDSEIRLIESPLAFKANALNLGDEYAVGFPRVYLDADIQISGEDIRKLADELKKGVLLAASPALKIEIKGRPWSIKAFYKIWCYLPFVTEGTIGCGIYTLSKQGRERFDKFPEITADDSFVRFLFSSTERGVVKNATFIISLPMCLLDLINIRIRQCFEFYEFKKAFPELVMQHSESNTRGIFFLFSKISLWPALLVYISINSYSRLGGVCKFWFGNRQYWNKDELSRF
jgi:glycosyltransferase involved in cell wall biosynthesis